jgi:hypothetical protein
MTPDDRRAEDVVRRALETHADRVTFAPDALGSIRSRIDRSTRQRRRMTMSVASAAAGALATVTAVVVGVASCVPPTNPQPTFPPGASSTTGPAPTSAAPAGTVPVYYLGETGNRIVLYREFRPAAVGEDNLTAWITAAVTDMLTGRPADADYRTGWPASARVREVRLDGDVAVVDLTGAASNSVGSEAAEMTVQQLVWTVTAVGADRGTQLRGVRLRLDGADVTELWGHVAVGGVLTRAAAVQTQAPVWLISPQEGATVGPSFRVHLDGAVFEATAQLRVRDGGGVVVHEQFVTLSNGAPARGEAFVDLELEPGRYTLEAFFFSPQDGSVQGLDDHAITVE